MTDEELLSEYADGRLQGAEAAAFEARLKSEPALAKRLRLLRAMKLALAGAVVPAPASLKASLREAARQRSQPWWLVLLKEAFTVHPSSVAAAGAFAAAVFVLAVRSEKPVPQPGAVPAPVTRVENPATPALESNQALAAELWSDDEGDEDDAI